MPKLFQIKEKEKEKDKIMKKYERNKTKKHIKKTIITNNIIKYEKNYKFNLIRVNYNMANFCIKILVIFDLLNIVSSDLGIIINASHTPKDGPYKIFNCSKFKAPDKLILNGKLEKINKSNHDNFIYIKSALENDHIILMWECSEDKDILNYIKTLLSKFEFLVFSFKHSENPSPLEDSQLNGIGLFQDCLDITSVDFSYFDTNLIKNMHRMFDSCTKLSSVTDLSLDNVQSMSYLFNNCISLKSVIFNNSVPKEADMQYMFNNCSNLETLNLSMINTEQIKNMESMFYNCEKLKNLILGNVFVFTNVENMINMFANCKSLESLTIGTNAQNSIVKKMNSMFYNCINLKTLNLKFKASNIINMEFMFYGCSSLLSLDLSNFQNTKDLESIEAMFYGCSKLLSLNINTLITTKVSKMNYLFYGCKSLYFLNLNTFNTINVEYMDYMFYN